MECVYCVIIQAFIVLIMESSWNYSKSSYANIPCPHGPGCPFKTYNTPILIICDRMKELTYRNKHNYCLCIFKILISE